jgi:hypothetical protein
MATTGSADGSDAVGAGGIGVASSTGNSVINHFYFELCEDRCAENEMEQSDVRSVW